MIGMLVAAATLESSITMLFDPPVSSPVLALLTTIHLALAALRNHRTPSKGLFGAGVVSLLMAGLPWTFPSGWGVAMGLMVHAAWFAACERLLLTASTALPAPSPVVRPLVAAPGSVSVPGPAGPRGFVQAPVLATFDETPSIRTIRIARPEGFHFEAGQFVPVRTKIDGKDLTRCYSISSAPEAVGYLEISVKRQGVVSTALHTSIRPGSLLSIRQPAGSFKYPGLDDRPLVLVAGGVGITPLMSMLRHGVTAQPARPMTLVYGAHTAADFAFRDELECLSRRHPQLRLQLAASSGPVASDVYPGRIDSALLGAVVPDLSHSIVMMCGPAAMIAGLSSELTAAGVPASQIRHEVFEAAIAASSDAPARAPVPSRGASFHVSCTQSDRQLEIRANQTLLEAAEDAGVPIPSLCRAGVCGTCRIQVTAGEVDCESATLSADEIAQGFVLACVTTAKSDCAVSA